MKKLLVAAGVWQFLRIGRRRRRAMMRRLARRNTAISTLALVAGGAIAYAVMSRRGQQAGERQWPSRKKLEREARQAEGRSRAQQGKERSPEVRVERNAGTDLKVPLGDLKR